MTNFPWQTISRTAEHQGKWGEADPGYNRYKTSRIIPDCRQQRQQLMTEKKGKEKSRGINSAPSVLLDYELRRDLIIMIISLDFIVRISKAFCTQLTSIHPQDCCKYLFNSSNFY